MAHRIRHESSGFLIRYSIHADSITGMMYVGELLQPDGAPTGYVHSASDLTAIVAWFEPTIAMLRLTY